MSKIRLTGSNSGYVEIASAADAGNLTFVLPTSGTSLLGNGNNVYTGITTFTNDFKLEGGSYDVLWDASDNQLEFDDNAKLSFGDSSDLSIYHDGNHNIFNASNGFVKFNNNVFQVYNQGGNNISFEVVPGSYTKLFHGTSNKLQTTNTGVVVSGIITATEINYTGGQNLSNRNKVINGAMNLSQRGTSFSPGDSDELYTLDRFEHFATDGANGNSTITHSEDHPDGFTHSYKITPDTGHSPTGSGNVGLRTKIEGQDLQDLAFATSSAKKVTLSFYAKSAAQNSGQQYTVQLRKFASSGQDTDRRSVNAPFTVTTSWQRFTFTFDGDTSKDIVSDNSLGMEIVWILNSGSDDITSAYPTWSAVPLFSAVTGQSNFMSSTSNYFYITGVQLEIGSVATPFEHRSFGDELSRCQRYYQTGYFRCRLNGRSSSSQSEFTHYFKGTMRANPTVTTSDTLGTLDSVTFSNFNGNGCFLDFTGATSNNFAAIVNASAEL